MQRRAAQDLPRSRSLWADHLFEPLLEWVNDTLATAVWMELTDDTRSSTTARLMTTRPLEPAGRLILVHDDR